MNTDPASLENLRDIAEPSEVSWYPLAPGWWILMGVVLVVGLVLGVRAWLRWKRDAYRRAALNELEAGGDLARTSSILKRTALVAFPRSKVAALTGPAWCQWLEETGTIPMSDQVREELGSGVYGDPGAACSSEALEYSRSWIAKHRLEAMKGGEGC